MMVGSEAVASVVRVAVVGDVVRDTPHGGVDESMPCQALAVKGHVGVVLRSRFPWFAAVAASEQHKVATAASATTATGQHAEAWRRPYFCV